MMSLKKTRLLLFSLMASLILVFAATRADAQNFVPNPLQNPICSRIGNPIQVSLGLRMYCFGRQPNGPGTGTSPSSAPSSPGTTLDGGGGGTSGFSPNVDAASLAEDISPGGSRAYGQAETSIAASGRYVLEAWNDVTASFSLCPSPMNKEELTGAGFSTDGGNTFTDLGGLPNSDCLNNRLFGDPSVEVFHAPNGATYFYISSLYLPINPFSTDRTSKLAVNVCTVSGSGNLSCSQPVIAAKSSECFFDFCSVLDKEFMTLDPVNNRLYLSYTEFGALPQTANGQVELAACDLTDPASPVCENGSNGPSSVMAPPYYVVAPADANCEQEGAYPAVDRTTGDVYVAWEFNWVTNFLVAACASPSTPVHLVLARVPGTCLGSGPPSTTTTCPQTTTTIPVVSMDLAMIPGYNRFPMNDFPRIAVSERAGTVSVVWNDAGRNPGGDILLQSFNLGPSLTPVGLAPVKINNDSALGTFHFLPALRNADSNGNISISWYDRRRNPNSALTDVFAAVSISPRIANSPSNQRVTDVASDWLAVSSDIIPNFGDYTDNYASPPPALATDDDPLFVGWTDGRLNDPQPFESHIPLPVPH